MTAQVFRSDEFELSVITDNGTGRVHAPTLAKYLGFRDAGTMVRGLEADEKVLVRGYTNLRTPADQDVWYVTEPGFYKTVGQRNVNVIKDPAVREATHRFQRWVFHVVLPERMRGGWTDGPQPGCTWSWEDVAAQVRQRYGLDYQPTQITAALRAAGWLKSGTVTPKTAHRHKFWHTGTSFHLLPHALPELVATLVATMRRLGDPQAHQIQLPYYAFPALEV